MNWGNPHEFLSRYPAPFRGHEDENIFDFIKDLEEAFQNNQVPASSQVKILTKHSLMLNMRH